jgi:hypothetical protein
MKCLQKSLSGNEVRDVTETLPCVSRRVWSHGIDAAAAAAAGHCHNEITRCLSKVVYPAVARNESGQQQRAQLIDGGQQNSTRTEKYLRSRNADECGSKADAPRFGPHVNCKQPTFNG